MKRIFFAALLFLAALHLPAQEQVDELTYMSVSGGYYVENGSYTGALEIGVLYKSFVGGINFSYYDKPMNKLFFGVNLEKYDVSLMLGGAFGLSGYKGMEEKEASPSMIAGGWGRVVLFTNSTIAPFLEYCNDYIFTSKEAKSRLSFGIRVLLE